MLNHRSVVTTSSFTNLLNFSTPRFSRFLCVHLKEKNGRFTTAKSYVISLSPIRASSFFCFFSPVIFHLLLFIEITTFPRVILDSHQQEKHSSQIVKKKEIKMEEDCRPLGSDVEGHDVVDVDDDATSVTDSELSVASSRHRHQSDHQREILTSPPDTTGHEIDKKRTKKTATAKKKSPATKKTSKPAAKKKKTTTKTTGETVTSHVDHAAETAGDSGSESSCGLEASVEQVSDRFAQGCECRDGESCFSNINPESAYRHRLNIAELTRSEHDMYLMGVTMASLSNPEETARRTERKRLHTQYVFQVRYATP